MEICGTNLGGRLPNAFLSGTKRITKSNITRAIDSEHRAYIIIGNEDKLFLHNPMMYMAHKGRQITEEFNILAFNSLLVLEFSPEEFLFCQDDISSALDILHEFIDRTMSDVRELSDTGMYVIRLEVDCITEHEKFVVHRMLKNIGLFKKEKKL